MLRRNTELVFWTRCPLLYLLRRLRGSVLTLCTVSADTTSGGPSVPCSTRAHKTPRLSAPPSLQLLR